MKLITKLKQIFAPTPTIKSLDLSPIIILGVPRSGTTLLRVLLDSHSQVAGPPETPWILGSYHPETSFRTLTETLCNVFTGPVKNLEGITEKVIFDSIRQSILNILEVYLNTRGKEKIVLKTPDDIYYLEFLLQLFPDAKYLHIHRDGRDVAHSTINKKKDFFGEAFQKGYGEINFYNSVKRWVEWEEKIRKTFKRKSKNQYHRVSYESLINKPKNTLTSICEFMEISFELEMLDYKQFSHEYPNYEAGSFDVRNKTTIEKNNSGKWKGNIDAVDLEKVHKEFGKFIKRYGYAL